MSNNSNSLPDFNLNRNCGRDSIKAISDGHCEKITIEYKSEEEGNKPEKFCLSTDDIVQILEENAKDLVNGEITYDQAAWYLKGVVGVASKIVGPARLVLVKQLTELGEAFSEVDRTEYVAIEKLVNLLRDHILVEMGKR